MENDERIDALSHELRSCEDEWSSRLAANKALSDRLTKEAQRVLNKNFERKYYGCAQWAFMRWQS